MMRNPLSMCVLLLCFSLVRVDAEAPTCSESDPTCSDQTTLLQSRVKAESLDADYSDDPSLVEHGHRTTMEVDLTTTKIIAGVPIYNYHMANAGGMTPSLAELTQQKEWILTCDNSASALDEAAICDKLKNLQTGAQCTSQGSGSPGGEPYVVVQATEAELQALLSQHFPHVSFAEPNGQVTAVDAEPDASLSEELLASVPWGLDRIDAGGRDGSFSVPANSNEGAGAHVYVADTGILTTHTDFGGRATPAYDYYKSGSNKVCGTSDSNCAIDRHGHGTHCAGTIGGKKYGVAKKTSLYAAKVLSDRGGGSYAGIIGSLDYVMTKGNKPAVWSASLGGPGTSHTMKAAIDRATNAGVLVSVAAGNSNSDACNFNPAFVPSAVTVGATSSSDARAGFSNYGSCLDLYAPGVNILSAGHRSNTASATMSGTSMACPHVSGVAALLFADFPAADRAQIEGQLKSFAEKSKVTDPKPGSPNLLLHIPAYTPGGKITTVITTTTTSTTTTMFCAPGATCCSFESSTTPYCGQWVNARSGDKFDWTRKSGGTSSYNTGPDKASQGSYYLYVETSWPRRNGDNAILSTSKALPIYSSGTLSFDYHMKGANIKSLNVKCGSRTIFQKTGQQPGNWKSATLSLSACAGPSVMLSFEATRGTSWAGDIAIDNVNLNPGSPPATTAPPTTAPPTTAPPMTTAPPTTAPTTPPSLEKMIDALNVKVDTLIKLLNSLLGGR